MSVQTALNFENKVPYLLHVEVHTRPSGVPKDKTLVLEMRLLTSDQAYGCNMECWMFKPSWNFCS